MSRDGDFGSHVVPEAEAFVVEYPGYVRDVPAVMQSLGGSSALAAAANGDNSVLQLRFRPDDPLSHPLYGERQATNGLVLKLTRQSADPENAQVSAEVVARVQSKFTFTGMADYQYLPFDQSRSDSASSKSTGPYGDEKQPLLCIPPLFTKSDIPLDYAFKQFRASDKPVSRSKPSPHWLISYTSQQIPDRSSSVVASQEAQPDWVRAQLDTRPIWTQASIAQQMPADTQSDLDIDLPARCFQFKEGPWKGAWIRHGHDPRTDSSSWKYQTLLHDLPPEWYANISARSQAAAESQATAGTSTEPAPSLGDIQRFAALPTAQSTIFQLCDLSAPMMQILLSQLQTQDVCSPTTGWLSQEDWQKLVNAVTEGFAKLL